MIWKSFIRTSIDSTRENARETKGTTRMNLNPLEIAEQIYHILEQPILPENLKEAYELGMIKKEDLIDGKQYLGYSRNTDKAYWSKENNVFTFLNSGHFEGDGFEDHVPHPENDDGYDIFVPIEEIE